MRIHIILLFCIEIFTAVFVFDDATEDEYLIPHSSVVRNDDVDYSKHQPHKVYLDSPDIEVPEPKRSPNGESQTSDERNLNGLLIDFRPRSSNDYPVAPENSQRSENAVFGAMAGPDMNYGSWDNEYGYPRSDLCMPVVFPVAQCNIVEHYHEHNYQIRSGMKFDISNLFVRTADATTRLVTRKVHPQKKRFVPLSCNDQIQFAKCASWEKTFGSDATFSDLVVIPCGKCITMDFSGAILTLQDGIDIVGKLVVPNGYQLTLKTSMIVVQGVLEMTSTKPVDGIPDIEVIMVGQIDRFFTPQGENSSICGQNQKCLAGKKAITVAGGRIDVNGLPNNTPTWVPMYSALVDPRLPNMSIDIVVDSAVKSKWSKGAEILITSHTQDWTGQQVARIVSISNYVDRADYILLRLEMPIRRPTTIKESPDFAVEVALLSRNIVFIGGPDDVTNHGGHFWVQFTPTVVQSIIGIEIVNFGQQGSLGRYPIHFHMSASVEGSIVAKNSVRQSNQRCIVVHGTNDLLVEENIAYDTKGHCYMLEDGIETGNVFRRNLGALTKIPELIIRPEESDFDASTFWITNPSNSFEGNVAAGSARIGYWFQLLKRGELKDSFPELTPDKDPLTLFEGNVAHSNRFRGITTYPTGYEPRIMGAAIFEGIKSYRNRGQGMFFHISRNIIVRDGLLADNKGTNIDIDRADAVIIVDSTIVAESDSYQDLVDTQDAESVCNFDDVFGIDLHTWKNNIDDQGNAIERVRFRNFGSKVCPNAKPFHFDDTERTGIFNLYTTLEGIVMEGFNDGQPAFDFCDAAASGVQDVYINVLDGRVFPTDSSRDQSAVISNAKNMIAFVAMNQCQVYKSSCYVLCRRHCFSSFRFDIDPANTENFQLRICKRSSIANCIFFRSGKFSTVETILNNRRTFIGHVPSGSYDAAIVDNNLKVVWPTFVIQRDEHFQCQTAKFPKANVKLTIPSVPSGSCNQLIRNPMMEQSINSVPVAWLSRFGTIAITSGKGSGRSDAIVELTRSGTPTLGQFLDSRCIKQAKGMYYEVTAFVKMTFLDGSISRCITPKMKCPELGLLTSAENVTIISTVEQEIDREGFQRVNGFVRIDENIVASDQVFVFVRYNYDNRIVHLDNFTMRMISDPKAYCNNIVMDSGMENLAMRYWQISGSGLIEQGSGMKGSNALFYSNRKSSSDGITYREFRNINKDCLTPRSKWRVTAQVKMTPKSKGGSACVCDITKSCPQIQILMNDANGNRFFTYGDRSYSAWKPSDFNLFTGTFQLPALGKCSEKDCGIGSSSSWWDGSVGPVTILIRSFPLECNLYLDDFVIARLS